ncbi:MAG: hypothetical protein KY462_08710 [Actinobacteria bacterium]|nr:hypothetical protein [Actinomycetota bacterium]
MLVVLVLATGMVGPTASGVLAAGPSSPPREVPGLRQTPDIPVRTVGQRRAVPDHPRQTAGKGGGCDKDVDLTTTLDGVVTVAAQNNGICTTADIDTYQTTLTTYVVQAGGEEAAWTHTDVGSPSDPQMVGQFTWSGGAGKNTYTPDVKAFHQAGRRYLALSLERFSLNAYCGVVLVDVTQPSNPQVESQIYKDDRDDFWCDVHNSFVEDADGDGDADLLYLTADARNDLRVVDISDVEQMPNACDVAAGCDREVGIYTAPTADNNNYVHDVTVLDHGSTVGRRVYLAYWDSGVVILDADEVATSGWQPLVGPDVIDERGFLAHHAWASRDGSLVFTQDEFLEQPGDEPVQMWAVDGLKGPEKIDSLVLGADVPANPAHNLEIRFDLDFDRLYVGWYKLGLQGWDFDAEGFQRTTRSVPFTATVYHQAQTEAADDAYDGAWGVRLAQITVGQATHVYVFQSDRRYGLIIDCIGCTSSDVGGDEQPCPPGWKKQGRC